MNDIIPVRLPSGGKAIIELPRPFTVADATHLIAFLTQYIEDTVHKEAPEKVMRIMGQHKNLGPVFITDVCLAMQASNPDKTSMFVEHDGEIKEVTCSRVTINKETHCE